MNEILRFLLEHCSFLYEEHGFRFVDSDVGDAFGNAAVYLASGDITIRFIRDRGQLFADFQSNHTGRGPNSWYTVDLVQQLVTKTERFHALMDEQNAALLRKCMPQILRLFEPKRMRETGRELRLLERARAKKVLS